MLNLANFTVTQLTGAVTLQVLGNVKLAASILFSWIIFQNQISQLCWFGLLICFSGVMLYHHGVKILQERQKKPEKHEQQPPPQGQEQQEELQPMLPHALSSPPLLNSKTSPRGEADIVSSSMSLSSALDLASTLTVSSSLSKTTSPDQSKESTLQFVIPL